MANPLKTEHALDWSKTAQEVEDQFQLGMIERDRFREALEGIYATPKGYQDVCWNLAADALSKPRPK